MRITAQDLYTFGNRRYSHTRTGGRRSPGPRTTIMMVGAVLRRISDELLQLDAVTLQQERYMKYRTIGQFYYQQCAVQETSFHTDRLDFELERPEQTLQSSSGAHR